MKRISDLTLVILFSIVLIAGCINQEQPSLNTKDSSETMETVKKVTEDLTSTVKTAASNVLEETKKEIIASTAKEAIAAAKNLSLTKEKVGYLVTQANNLYSSEKFQDVVDIAKYILTYLDKDSQPAKNLLDKAKSKLTSMLEQKASDYSQKIGNFGK